MSQIVRILSIDGGGIRGIIPALILAELEQRTGKPVSQLFDLIAGTSVGGIIALGLTIPGKDAQPKYTASDMVQFFVKDGAEVFSQTFWHKVISFGGFVEEKYPSAGIDAVLDRYFGETSLDEALTELLIPGYEIERRTAYFFKTQRARESLKRNILMKHVARATSAAPTYFEPAYIPTMTLQEYLAVVDGSVFANNPAMCAYVEAKVQFPDMNDSWVVSIGTGSYSRPIPYQATRGWGLANWAQPILDIVFDGISDTVDYQLQQLLPGMEGKKRYYRFQSRLNEDDDSLDNTKPNNLRILRLMAEELIRERHDELTMLSKQLLETT